MNKFLACPLAILLLFSNYAIAQSEPEKQHRRFSIAISGGASMGAYEAGLNWGLLKILKDFSKIDPELTGRTHDFNAVSFTGASAGSINTVLSALTWCSRPESENGLANSIDNNIFRDLWLLVDVNHLLPTTADSKFYSADDALLSRYDLLQASRGLREKWNKPIFRPGCRVPLGVTVTRVIPDKSNIGNVEVLNQRMYIPFEAFTRKNGSLAFGFDPDDYPGLTDPAMILLPNTSKTTPYLVDDQGIEDALMASSAFPGGFGRKRLQYCQLIDYDDDNNNKSGERTGQKIIKKTVSCPKNYELKEAEFSDGSVFDNLPIGLARKLAEQYKYAGKNELPVTYIYLDPNRERYQSPLVADTRACASDNPPEACRTMEYSFFTEQALLLGALGTARKYELYRELTSEFWSLNLTELSYELADNLAKSSRQRSCRKIIPFFSYNVSCAGSVRRAGALLELSYLGKTLQLSPPYSPRKLSKLGIVYNCKYAKKNSAIKSQAECSINVERYRKYLSNILLKISAKNKNITKEFRQRIKKSIISIHNDRLLRVTNRGAPITGTLLSSFGAFLDFKFREYDYYVGVYDSIIAATNTICGLRFSEQYQDKLYTKCQSAFASEIYNIIGVSKDPRAQYVIARLAQWEYGKQKLYHSIYTPLPKEDKDMRIIFDGLMKTFESGKNIDERNKTLFFTEDEFFLYLKNNNFQPTVVDGNKSPLLKKILEEPANWNTEMIRRVTTRMVYLENQAEKIYIQREPDPEKRESSYAATLGITAHLLQKATYNYPVFSFAPSTAAEDWAWRYVIPYEVSYDVVSSDLKFTWQPTWSMTDSNLLSIRATAGFVGGLFDNSKTENRENYGALGLEYAHQTGSITLSKWGLAPTWYHSWVDPRLADQDTLGGDIHVSFYKDSLRLGLGVRDYRHSSDTWFLTFGITDVPGLGYWLTR